ncbi:MAG: hypothetical protein ACYCPQ_09725 [Elusimicrobiota bacterium]
MKMRMIVFLLFGLSLGLCSCASMISQVEQAPGEIGSGAANSAQSATQNSIDSAVSNDVSNGMSHILGR